LWQSEEKMLAIPATAVLYAPYGDTVFIIEDKKNEKTGQMEKILRQQIVQLGGTRGDFVSVLSGLKEGETVVTSGVFKLRPNMPVVVDMALNSGKKIQDMAIAIVDMQTIATAMGIQ